MASSRNDSQQVLDGARWRRVRTILESALELGREERDRFLATECASDPALRAEVESILAADECADSFLHASPKNTSFTLSDPASIRELGARVGAYELVRSIATGGMGAVYLARRADGQFEQEVAVKLLNRRVVTQSAIRTFRAEQQALARLAHPNIARMFDGGLTEDGLPYIVMDYVDGRRIDQHCDDHRLSIPNRVELFLEVCDAVAFAHRNLVIHRDVKPGNILVDKQGHPKLLDFGIAKILDPESIGDEPTLTHSRAFTPEFASPEQLAGKVVTTATDVYSLGALLYLLLTGCPIRGAWGDDTDIRELITREAPPPSKAVRQLPAHVAVDAWTAARGGTPDQISRALSGDLDVILETALRPDPADRYGSVERFAQDLRDHHRCLPITARPATWRYRAAKFTMRNRATVAMAAIGVLGLIAATTGTALGLLEAQAREMEAVQANREAVAARGDAENARDEAESVTGYLVSMLESVDPRKLGRDALVRDLLDHSSATIPDRFATNPLVEARLHSTLGLSYFALGYYDQAEAQQAAAAAILQRKLGPHHEKTIAATNALANTLVARGTLTEAGEMLQRNFELRRRILGEDHRDTLAAANDLANSLNAKGKYAESETLLRATIEVQRRALGPEHVDTLTSVSNLALALSGLGRFSEAVSLFQDVIDARIRVLGEENVHTLNSMNNFANTLRARGQYREATNLLRKVCEVRLRVLGQEHAATLRSQNDLALVLREQGRPAEAARMLREGLEIQRRVLGETHPGTLGSVTNLAAALYDLGQYEQAEELQVQSIESHRKTLGARHPRTLTAMNNLALTLNVRGRHAEAEALQRETIDLRREVLGPEHPETLSSMNSLAQIFFDQGCYSECDPLIRETLEIQRRVLGEDHPETLASVNNLAEIMAARNDLDEARALFEVAIGYKRIVYSNRHPSLANSLSGLADVACKQGHPQEAYTLHQEALEIRLESLPDDHPDLAVGRSAMAGCLISLGRSGEAEPLLLASMRAFEEMQGRPNPAKAKTLERLVELYSLLGKTEESTRYAAMLSLTADSN